MNLRKAVKANCRYAAKRVVVGAFVMYVATLVFVGGCFSEFFVRDDPDAR